MTKAQMQAELDKLRAEHAELVALLTTIGAVVLPMPTDPEDYAFYAAQRHLAVTVKSVAEIAAKQGRCGPWGIQSIEEARDAATGQYKVYEPAA